MAAVRLKSRVLHALVIFLKLWMQISTQVDAQVLECPERGDFVQALREANASVIVHIICRHYRFGGPLPVQIGRLTRLKELIIPRNRLTGTLPTEIGLLEELTKVDLQENVFTGNIPSEFGNLVKLNHLRLGYNQWNWSLPISMERLHMLGLLEATYSGMKSLPEALYSYTRLKSLRLKGNAIKQRIPRELSALTALEEFHLGENQLFGAIPPQLSTWRNLERFNVHGNDISSTLPTEIGYWTNVRAMTFFDNQFEGLLPTEFGRLTAIGQLLLQENRFSGQIPSQLGRLEAVQDLRLYTNFFTGSIPIQLRNLGALTVFRVDPSLLKPCELQFAREIKGWDKSENCSVAFDHGQLNFTFTPTVTTDTEPTMRPSAPTNAPTSRTTSPSVGATTSVPRAGQNLISGALVCSLVLLLLLGSLVRCVFLWRRLQCLQRKVAATSTEQSSDDSDSSFDRSKCQQIELTSRREERTISPT